MSETFHRWFTSFRLFTFRKILCLISNNKKGLCFTGGCVTHGSWLFCMVQSSYIFFKHVNESLYEIFVLPLCTWLVGVPREKRSVLAVKPCNKSNSMRKLCTDFTSACESNDPGNSTIMKDFGLNFDCDKCWCDPYHYKPNVSQNF